MTVKVKMKVCKKDLITKSVKISAIEWNNFVIVGMKQIYST